MGLINAIEGETDADVLSADLHGLDISVTSLGSQDLFEHGTPFTDFIGKFEPMDFIGNSPGVKWQRIDEYPQNYLNRKITSPAAKDGVIEPLTIRDAMLDGIESPFTVKKHQLR